MSERILRLVDPRTLYLPPSRETGADPVKLHDQKRRFRESSEDMPPIEVHEDPVGKLVIYDGVTRAFRMAEAGKLVPVMVSRKLTREIAKLPIKLSRVGDVMEGPRRFVP